MRPEVMEIWSQPGSSALTGLKGRARENPVKCGNCEPNALPPQRAAGSARRSTSSDPASGGLQFTLRTSPATCHRPPPGPLGELTRLGCCRTLRAPSTPALGGAGRVAPGLAGPLCLHGPSEGHREGAGGGTAKEPAPDLACAAGLRALRPLSLVSAPSRSAPPPSAPSGRLPPRPPHPRSNVTSPYNGRGSDI